jgi:hypothetical protein
MIVTNTFHHTRDKRRFRAVLFTSENMTPEVYSLIYGWIADKLEEAGYSVNRNKKRKRLESSNTRPSGLDWQGSRPHSLFHLPCQAENPKDSFFREHIEGRQPLDPSTWIENSAIPLQPTLEKLEPDSESQDVNRDLVHSAIQTWRTSKGQKGRGNEMFFALALSLKRAGMTFREIESTLRAEAHHGRRPNKRLAQITSIIDSLQVYATSWKGRAPAIEVPAV